MCHAPTTRHYTDAALCHVIEYAAHLNLPVSAAAYRAADKEQRQIGAYLRLNVGLRNDDFQRFSPLGTG